MRVGRWQAGKAKRILELGGVKRVLLAPTLPQRLQRAFEQVFVHAGVIESMFPAFPSQVDLASLPVLHENRPDTAVLRCHGIQPMS